jgi:RNA recognition motif-containing protein
MISVKTSLAFLITFVLAFVAYFLSSAEFATSMTGVIASIFVVLTTLSLLAVSNIHSSAQSTRGTAKTPSAAATSSNAVSSSTGSTATLYVGNLAYKANEQTVQEFFETVGTVKSVRLVKDKRTGRRKGFGFIEINTGDENTFISKLNESEFMERNIIVRPANEKQH